MYVLVARTPEALPVVLVLWLHWLNRQHHNRGAIVCTPLRAMSHAPTSPQFRVLAWTCVLVATLMCVVRAWLCVGGRSWNCWPSQPDLGFPDSPTYVRLPSTSTFLS